MMIKPSILTTGLLTSVLLLSACAHSYQPVVELKGVDMQKYQQDLAECRQYADQIDVAGDTATNTLVGAGIGAAFGAALGAATGGGVGTGAMVGTTIGGFGGGGATAAEAGQRQKNIINNCLTGRGYRLLG